MPPTSGESSPAKKRIGQSPAPLAEGGAGTTTSTSMVVVSPLLPRLRTVKVPRANSVKVVPPKVPTPGRVIVGARLRVANVPKSAILGSVPFHPLRSRGSLLHLHIDIASERHCVATSRSSSVVGEVHHVVHEAPVVTEVATVACSALCSS